MLPRHSDPTISGNACPTTSITGQCKLAISRTTSPRAVGPASKVTSKVFAENSGCWNFTLYEPGSTVENANLPWLSVLTSTVVELDRVIVVLVIAAPLRSITTITLSSSTTVEVKTDSQGKFAFSTVEPGSYKVKFQQPEFS